MRESKGLYEALNDIGFNIEDYEKETLSEPEKKRMKKNFMRKRRAAYNFKKIGAIVAVFALVAAIFSQTNFSKSAYAATQSKLLEISYSIGNLLGIEGNIEPYTNEINKVVENNGIEIKLTEVIIDEDELYFATIVDTGTPMDMVHFDFDIFVNGKRLETGAGGGATTLVGDSDTLFSSYYSTKVMNADLTGDLNIKILLNSLNYYENKRTKTIKGPWPLEFSANGKELRAETKKVPVEYTFYIGDEKYILEEFTYNPVKQRISGKLEVEGDGFSNVDFLLKGEDNLGGTVEFDGGSMSVEHGINFNRNRFFGDLDPEITSIILAPYIREMPEGGGRVNSEWKQIGEPFTINLR